MWISSSCRRDLTAESRFYLSYRIFVVFLQPIFLLLFTDHKELWLRKAPLLVRAKRCDFGF